MGELKGHGWKGRRVKGLVALRYSGLDKARCSVRNVVSL